MKNYKAKIIYPLFFIKHYKAIQIVKQLFDGKYRKTWEPLFHHSYRMFQKCIQYKVYDEWILQGVLLHDIVEDSFFDLKDIEMHFWIWISEIVDGMTCKNYWWDNLQKHIYFEKFKTFSQDEWRLLVVKLLDCIDNLETLHWLEKEKQIRFVKEKTDIYLPIFQQRINLVPINLRDTYKNIFDDFRELLNNFIYE